MQKRKTALVICSFLAGITILSGCGSEATMQQVNSPLSVQVAEATNGWISQGPVYIGTIQPEREIQTLPKVPGKVASVNVSVGSHVKAGDTLYTLDNKDFRDAVNQAQAAFAAAQAGVQTATTQQQASLNQASGGAVTAKSGLIQTQNAVTQAQNAVTMTKQALDLATTNKNRYEQLFAANAVSKSDLDTINNAYVKAQTDYSNAQAALAAAQQAMQNASSGYQTAQSQIQVAQSTAGIIQSKEAVKTAQAALQAAQDQLADTTIKSPIDGIVGIKNINPGDFVNPDFPSTEPVMVVASMDPVKVLVYIPANTINSVKVGDSVMLKVVALNTYFEGQVKNISPLDNQGKGYPVEISVPNPKLQLKKGMVTEVSLLGPNSKQGILIPTSAIFHNNGKTYVYVDNNNVAKQKEVVIGQQQGSQTLVTNGLHTGDIIITNQLSQLKDSMKIKVDTQSNS